jgi:hypothetical protein
MVKSTSVRLLRIGTYERATVLTLMRVLSTGDGATGGLTVRADGLPGLSADPRLVHPVCENFHCARLDSGAASVHV